MFWFQERFLLALLYEVILQGRLIMAQKCCDGLTLTGQKTSGTEWGATIWGAGWRQGRKTDKLDTFQSE